MKQPLKDLDKFLLTRGPSRKELVESFLELSSPPPKVQLRSYAAAADIRHTKIAEFKKYLRAQWRSYAPATRGSLDIAEALREEISKRHAEREEVAFLKDQILKRLDEVTERLHATPIIRNTFIIDLGSEKYLLTTPINIVLEEYDDEVLARWPEVEATGSGETESEAIMSLKNDVISLYKDLMATPDAKLGKLPKSWQCILKKIVKEK